jgi:hypothetical protein
MGYLDEVASQLIVFFTVLLEERVVGGVKVFLRVEALLVLLFN